MRTESARYARASLCLFFTFNQVDFSGPCRNAKIYGARASCGGRKKEPSGGEGEKRMEKNDTGVLSVGATETR